MQYKIAQDANTQRLAYLLEFLSELRYELGQSDMRTPHDARITAQLDLLEDIQKAYLDGCRGLQEGRIPTTTKHVLGVHGVAP